MKKLLQSVLPFGVVADPPVGGVAALAVCVVAALAVGGVAGSAVALGPGEYQCNDTNGSTIYPPDGVLHYCLPQRGGAPSAATVKGQHTYTYGQARAVFFDWHGFPITTTSWHLLSGTAWAAGWTVPTGTSYWRYDVENDSPYNDTFVGHS